jgi:hypothetical protein
VQAKDPKVASLFEQAERAKTFEDQRAALRDIIGCSSRRSLSAVACRECKVMEVAYIRQLAQERLEPAIPMGPRP